MSEERNPDYTIAFRKGRHRTMKIEIFRKSQWTNNQADDVYYRCRVDRVWHGGKHGRMTFMDDNGILAIMKKALAEGGIV